MTPLKPPWSWNEKYHRDFNHKNFLLPNFSSVNDTAELEIQMTPLKPKHDFESPYLILKRTSSKTISWVIILSKEKLWNSKLHFRFQRCQWHRWNRFWRLSKRLSRRKRSHMRNGFSLIIRDLYGVDWWKNLESKISWHCPFKPVYQTEKKHVVHTVFR
jgi:hypothetical protein